FYVRQAARWCPSLRKLSLPLSRKHFNYLLSVHGIPSIIGSVDFVVPDRQLQAASKVLRHLDQLRECRDSECIVGSNDRYTPPPFFHVHIGGSNMTVGLYLQSETLWSPPEIDQTLLEPQALDTNPYYSLASDKATLHPRRSGRGDEYFASNDLPVVIPRAIVLLEAVL
ncbi:hypothetical protein EJ03DRAFT_88113, partial [Teratosphaeria nubilosa]